MATIAIAYVAVSGQPFTPDDFNDIWGNATVTIASGEVVAAMIGALAVTKAKVNQDVAGKGLKKDTDGSLAFDLFGLTGYATSALSGSNVTLTPLTDKYNQVFTGTLTGPVVLNLSRTAAEVDHEFRIRLSIVTSATNTLTLQENGTGSIQVWNDVGTVNADIRCIFNGTAWEIAEINSRLT